MFYLIMPCLAALTRLVCQKSQERRLLTTASAPGARVVWQRPAMASALLLGVDTCMLCGVTAPSVSLICMKVRTNEIIVASHSAEGLMSQSAARMGMPFKLHVLNAFNAGATLTFTAYECPVAGHRHVHENIYTDGSPDGEALPKDELTHEAYWEHICFKDPCTEAQKAVFGLCGAQCGSIAHDEDMDQETGAMNAHRADTCLAYLCHDAAAWHIGTFRDLPE